MLLAYWVSTNRRAYLLIKLRSLINNAARSHKSLKHEISICKLISGSDIETEFAVFARDALRTFKLGAAKTTECNDKGRYLHQLN